MWVVPLFLLQCHSEFSELAPRPSYNGYKITYLGKFPRYHTAYRLQRVAIMLDNRPVIWAYRFGCRRYRLGWWVSK